MSSRSPEHWSLFRSLAFLAATFAIMLGAMLPSAASASAAPGSPVMLCSGEQMFVVHGEDGSTRPDQPSSMDGQTCASCILSAFTALPPPPPVHPVAPPRIVAVQPATLWTSPPPPSARDGLRPPSTAPPAA